MNPDPNSYQSPLSTRYASEAMRFNFSDQKKFTTWRRLWIALAEAEQELGLDIPDSALVEMRATVDELDLELAARYESELRHDVMAHVHAWGDACPTARPILHLGATSCYVGDNTDLVVMRDGLDLVERQFQPREIARIGIEQAVRPAGRRADVAMAVEHDEGVVVLERAPWPRRRSRHRKVEWLLGGLVGSGARCECGCGFGRHVDLVRCWSVRAAGHGRRGKRRNDQAATLASRFISWVTRSR